MLPLLDSGAVTALEFNASISAQIVSAADYFQVKVVVAGNTSSQQGRHLQNVSRSPHCCSQK
jgi:hypothetical protein